MFPEIVPGVAGLAGSTVTAIDEGDVVPQELLATTLSVPSSPVEPEIKFIDVAPCPDEIVHPAGTLHVYVVASGIANTV